MAPRKRMAALVRHVLTPPPSLGGDWVLLLYLDNESVIACPVAEADHSRPVVVLARADELEVLGPRPTAGSNLVRLVCRRRSRD